jgi:hypothetical protein
VEESAVLMNFSTALTDPVFGTVIHPVPVLILLDIHRFKFRDEDPDALYYPGAQEPHG